MSDGKASTTDVSPATYFTDDEHFNKQLQEGVAASVLFDSALKQHRHYVGLSPSDRANAAAAASGGAPTSVGRRRSSSVVAGAEGGAPAAAVPVPPAPGDANAPQHGAAAYLLREGGAAAALAGVGAASAQQPTATRGRLTDFPQITLDDPLYSSTVMMIKRTRADVAQLATELSAANMINDLPTSEEVRRVVARIFADPRNAEAISESEWRRREHAYLEQRNKLVERISDHLEQEKAALQDEIKRLGIDT